MYSRAKTVLIDDIFATLDKPVVDSLIEKCIRGELMQSRTIVLVTSTTDAWVRDASLLVYVNEGCVSTVEHVAAWIESNPSCAADGSMHGVEKDDVLDNLFASDSTFADEDFFDESSVMREPVRCAEDGEPEVRRSRDTAYAVYFAACGGWQFWVCAIGFTILARLANISESYWLKEGNIAAVLLLRESIKNS